MSDAIKTLGTVLAMSSEVGSPQAFVTLGNIQDFNKADAGRNIINTPNLASAAMTKMAGLLDEGDFNFTINWDPADSSHQAVIAARADGLAREFRVTFTDSGAAALHFNGIVKSFPINAPFDDKVTVNVGVAITGLAWIVY